MVRRFFLELSVLNEFRKPLSPNCVFSNKMVQRIKERFIFMKKSKSSDGISKMADQHDDDNNNTNSDGVSNGETKKNDSCPPSPKGRTSRSGSNPPSPKGRASRSGSGSGSTFAGSIDQEEFLRNGSTSADLWNPRTRVHGSGSLVGRTSPPPRNGSAPPRSLPKTVMQIHPRKEGRIKEV